ncbi:hypothetical protein SBV1_3300003 [Verrucomicrobia bacterium]|nr:hypothetical protein SBV1_3300003 [Verrucomicrobiota bacterium]
MSTVREFKAAAEKGAAVKEFITETLMNFKKGEITLEQAADRLLTRRIDGPSRKAKSNRRLKNLCGALRRERNTAKIRELKRALRQEFYYGDQGP